MTQYPGSTYPAPGPGYQTPYAPSPRPTSVTVLAIIGIVIGGLFVLCKPFGLLPLFLPNMGPPNPALDVLRTDATLKTLTIVGVIIGLPVSILLLASSIACLSLKRWARQGMLAYAALAIVLMRVTLAAQIVWVIPKLKAVQGQQASNVPQVAFLNELTGVPITVVEFIFRLIFPACLLFYFTRPHVIAGFENPQFPFTPGYGAPPYGQPGGYYAQPPSPPPGQYPPQQ